MIFDMKYYVKLGFREGWVPAMLIYMFRVWDIMHEKPTHDNDESLPVNACALVMKYDTET